MLYVGERVQSSKSNYHFGKKTALTALISNCKLAVTFTTARQLVCNDFIKQKALHFILTNELSNARMYDF